MTLQTARDAVQVDEGFIDYQGSWTNLFENVRCNIQESNLRMARKERWAKEEEINEDRIYFLRTDVYNVVQSTIAIRAITWRTNFSKKLSATELAMLQDNSNKDSFNIYVMNSAINITEGQIGTKKRVYILRCERTTKMDL